MISKITFAFLQAVKENNNLEWMNKNRDLYHMERDNFYAFVEKLIPQVQKLDKSIWNLSVKDCTFRFNKDIRFRKDKSPYKTNFWVIIREEGKKWNGAGYYVHIEPGKCFIGWGNYNPEKLTLQRIRSNIAKNYTQIEKIINAPVFKKTFGVVQGDRVKRVPKGFDKNHKAGELLKMKSRTVQHSVSDKKVIQKNFIRYCIWIFETMKPLNDFLNKE